MIGPGTGVAPFRGFIRERKKLAENGQTVGKSILFFGCRRSTEDFMYQKEWEVCVFSRPRAYKLCRLTLLQEVKQVLGDKFELVTAFSREGSKKVYVQHRLKERSKEINALLDQKAFFYVCGDAANMAREVNATLAQILADERGISKSKAEEIVKQMRASNQYQVCIQCQLFPHFRQ